MGLPPLEADANNCRARNGSTVKRQGPKKVWGLDADVRLLTIVLMDERNRKALARTGAKATRKDLDTGDSKQLSVWDGFAVIMNDPQHLVAPGESMNTRTCNVVHLPL